jgi:O-antigen/teichoic acid export membrane protein
MSELPRQEPASGAPAAEPADAAIVDEANATAGAVDILTSGGAGGRVIRGSAWRAGAGLAGSLLAIGTAALLLRHLGKDESGRYITVISVLAIPVAVADIGLNISGSRWLALCEPEKRRELVGNLLGQRLMIMPPAILLAVGFCAVAGYPSRMVGGAALAGSGFLLVSLANALLLPLTVELRNAGLALVDFTRQAVTLAGVTLLVILGSHLEPFFAVQIAVALVVLALIAPLAGRRAFLLPRFDRPEQRTLMQSALPLAAALTLGQLYFRLVIVLMSLISSPSATGEFGASLRAIEAPISISILVAGVALPLLAAAARDDPARLRYAISGLSEGALIAGVFIVIVTIRAAAPLMALIGGHEFRSAGAVLRIQVGVLAFNALSQVWTASLLALHRQRDLILTNLLALLGLGLFAALLVPALGARGGAIASVLGDALLCALIYRRLRLAGGGTMISLPFLARVAGAGAVAVVPLLFPQIPDYLAAALAAALFIGVGHLIGMVPAEVHEAFPLGRMLARAGLSRGARRR